MKIGWAGETAFSSGGCIPSDYRIFGCIFRGTDRCFSLFLGEAVLRGY